jgi:WhiB family transcriptional regulator, redox-sensing transcriptional regulator
MRQPKTCPVCKKGFIPSSGGSVNCSRECAKSPAREYLTRQTFLDGGTPACRGADTDLFSPPAGRACVEALKICAGCELLDPCRAWALRQPLAVLHGVWGGTTHEERKRLLRRR